MAAEAAPSYVLVPELGAGGDTLALAGDEAHYLSRVVRVRAGERVIATDGAGLVAALEVLETGASVRVRIVERQTRERVSRLVLWCGAPEGDRADWLVEKLAELGVATLQPVDTSRASWERFEAKRERWERLATAALRQSRSAFRMELREPVRLADAIAASPGVTCGWVGHPDGGPVGDILRQVSGQAVAAIGPSSGFSPEELNALRERGFIPVALARTRLRTETAALAMASAWAAAGCVSGGSEPGLPPEPGSRSRS